MTALTRRRALFGASAIAPLALAACAVGTSASGATTITVNLANAQAQAQTDLTALQTLAGGLVSQLSTSVQAAVSTGLSDLQTAVSAFAAIPSGSTTIAGLAQNVVAAINSVVPLLPLPALTQFAITESLALIQGLVAGVAAITVSTPTTVSARYGAKVVPGPISVPLS